MEEALPAFRTLNKARKVLGVPEIATLDQIKTAYRKLVLTYHPDRCFDRDKPLYTRKMAEINRAYRILMDYVQNYKYIFTEKAYREQDTEYAVRRFFEPRRPAK